MASSDAPRSVFIVRPALSQGGADRVTLTLLERLDRSRFRPVLVLLRRDGELLDLVPDDVPILRLHTSSLGTAWLPLARLLRAERPEIMLSTSGGANVAAALAHRATRSASRLVLSERNVLFRPPMDLRRRLLLLAKRRLYGRADAVIAVSNQVRQDLLEHLDLDGSKLHVVDNPVVDDAFAGRAAQPCGHTWFDEETPVVLAAGRLVPVKGFDTLLHAFAAVAKRHPARLILLGEGPERDRLEALAETLGLADSVSMPGFAANPLAFMSRCEVFVLSSRAEGLPGVLIQAMACGAASVSTDCKAGPSEILRHEETGLLVPVDDSHALAEAILRYLKDSDYRQATGKRARESVERFHVDRTVPRYEEILLG